ncbi:hypothetical protein [uncultured Psychrobacter sp.]|uniref:hypothetical protein n=1 Tax=uncultured Psychrobacter sp. TaxID=259303 RepID=UPI00345AB401
MYSIEDSIKNISYRKIDKSLLLSEINLINKNLPTNKKGRKKLIVYYSNKLIQHLHSRKYDESLGIARFIFMCNLDDSLEIIRKKGIFRASKYDYYSKQIQFLIKILLNDGLLTEEQIKYFRSLSSLLKLTSDVKSEKDKIIYAINSRRYFLKTILSFSESVFLDFKNVDIELKSINSEDERLFRSKELVLESTSTILQIYYGLKGVRDQDWAGIDNNFNLGCYWDIICRGHRIQEYNNSEINLDIFDYHARFENNILIISNEKFERAKANGFIKSELRSMSQNIQISNKYKEESVSLIYYFDKLWSNCSEKQYTLEKLPIERIRFELKIPSTNSSNPYSPMKNKSFFLEETIDLQFLCYENYNYEIIDKELVDGLSIFDFILAQRALKYISFLYQKALSDLSDEHDDILSLAISSILPVFKNESFVKILSLLTGLNNEKCSNLLDHISMSSCENLDFVDIQYTPVINSGDWSTVLPTVLGYSNIIRSIAIKNNVHLSSFNNLDYMVEFVANAFKSQGFQVASDFKFSQDEIDIVAYKNNHMFLFECKNPYHPVNDHELRNTYDHVCKAFKQIEKFKGILNDINKYKSFCQKLDFHITNDTVIRYGVINANRALTGYEKDGVRVVHANELVNFITTGRIVIMNEEYTCWKDNEFTVKDLISYMDGHLSSDILDVIEKIEYRKNYRSMSLVTNIYVYQPEVHSSLLQSKYRKVESEA